MKKKIAVLIWFVAISFSCKNNRPIESELYNQIEKYIKDSEDYSKTTSTYDERDIYIVKFKTIDSSKYVKIFENSYYYKKDLDGYFPVGDNKVFFYNSDEDFVHKNFLKSAKNIEEPDETSKMAEEGFNSINWYFEISNFKLTKISDENFFFY